MIQDEALIPISFILDYCLHRTNIIFCYVIFSIHCDKYLTITGYANLYIIIYNINNRNNR